ncbi:MAG TPA: hypothetical protein VIT65_09325 [Microlunatus sp.]
MPARTLLHLAQAMSTSADTDYLTFVSNVDRWSCYRGIGTGDGVAARRIVSAPLAGFASSAGPVGFGCYQPTPQSASVLIRIDLTTLDTEEVSWARGRIGAVACDAEAKRVVVLELPGSQADLPRILLNGGDGWAAIASEAVPDISSGLAWIGPDSVAFETSERLLAVMDLHDGSTRAGIAGSSPAGMFREAHWYAIVAGKPVVFAGTQAEEASPASGFTVTARPSSLHASADGQVLSWQAPHGPFKIRAFAQRQFGRRLRIQEADAGLAAVIGPVT